MRARRAGFLEEVRAGAPEVVLLRGDETLLITRGDAVLEGDIVRTTAGECLLVTAGGWSIGVAENSELLVRPRLVHRLGEVVYKVTAAMGVQVERVEVLVEGTTFRVQRGELGALQLHAGSVRLSGGNEVAVRPGQAVDFTLDGEVQAPRTMSPAERQDLVGDLKRLTRADGGRPLRLRRLHLMLGEGPALRQGQAWSSTSLAVQLRLLGPLWVDLDVGVLGRPLDLGAGVVASGLAFPISVGPRLAGTLGGPTYGRIGASFTALLGDRCVDSVTCERGIAPQPGVTVDMAVGLAFGRFVLELQGDVGVERQHLYDDVLDAVVQIPAGQLAAGLAFGVRL